MTYHIKPDCLSHWGEDTTEDTVIDEQELDRLCIEWDKTREELLQELIPID